MRAAALSIPPILGALFLSAAAPARAGEARCWYEHGAVVVSASLGDTAGDFILDLSAPRSLLHETRAQEDDVEGPDDRAPLKLAGERLDADFLVADLDARNLGFPTEISGVIGADVLAGQVIDLSLNPCRITLWPGRAPRLPRAQVLKLRMMDGVPAVAASVADGADARAGWFVVDTGSAGVRLAAHDAALSRSPSGVDAGSRSHPPARLRALSMGGMLLENLPAGLDPDAPPDRLGGIGDEVWARYAVRIDLGRMELELAPPSPSWGGKAGAKRRQGGGVRRRGAEVGKAR